jgi:hypothetical protein
VAAGVAGAQADMTSVKIAITANKSCSDFLIIFSFSKDLDFEERIPRGWIIQRIQKIDK